MSKQLLLLLIFLVFCDNAESQNNDNLKRNLIKGSFATSGIINGMVSMDYERNVIFRELIKFNIEGTFGKYYHIHVKEAFQSLPTFNSITSSINTLIGKRSHFLEISTGIRYSIIKADYYDDIKPIIPVLNIGYRFQNYSKTGLVFRTFFGSTGLGLSVGIAF